jgi:hypothetical protein
MPLTILDIPWEYFKPKIKSSWYNIHIYYLIHDSFPAKLILLIHSLKSPSRLTMLHTRGDSNFLRFNKGQTLPSYSYYIFFNCLIFQYLWMMWPEKILSSSLKIFPMNISSQSLKLLHILSLLYWLIFRCATLIC